MLSDSHGAASSQVCVLLCRLPPSALCRASFHTSPSSAHTLLFPNISQRSVTFSSGLWAGCRVASAQPHTFSLVGCGEGDRREQVSTCWVPAFTLRGPLIPSLGVRLVGQSGREEFQLFPLGPCPVHPGAVNTEARLCLAQAEGILGLFSTLLAHDSALSQYSCLQRPAWWPQEHPQPPPTPAGLHLHTAPC